MKIRLLIMAIIPIANPIGWEKKRKREKEVVVYSVLVSSFPVTGRAGDLIRPNSSKRR